MVTWLAISTKFFVTAMLNAALTSTILYNFHWPWPCQGVTRSAQSKTLCLNFLPHFSTDQDEIELWCWNNSSWTSAYYFWARCGKTREITAVLLTAEKNFQHWHTLRHLWIDLMQTWYDNRYYWTKQFDTSLIDHDLIQGHRSVRKQILCNSTYAL